MNDKNARKAVAQGALDGLCGIYSVINAIGLIEKRRMNDEDRKDLFVYLVDLLDDGRGIGSIIHNGILFRRLGELVDVASRLRAAKTKEIVQRQTAMKQNPDDMEEFWSILTNHVDVAKRQVAILGVSGKHNHWTVVKTVKPRRLELHDSGGLTHFDRSRCGLRDGEGVSHILWPTQTYLLWLEDDSRERLA